MTTHSWILNVVTLAVIALLVWVLWYDLSGHDAIGAINGFTQSLSDIYANPTEKA